MTPPPTIPPTLRRCPTWLGLAAVVLAPTFAVAQQRTMKADALSPFRNPSEDYAPPDEIYAALRIMRNIAEGPGKDAVSIDEKGRQICDNADWRAAFRRLEQAKGRGYEGYLARIMRHSNSVADRDTAFFGAFYGDDPGYVLELIAHIPGEPSVQVREKALLMAIPYLRAHLGRRFGDLSEEDQETMRAGRPKAGSPAARSQGLTDLTDDSWLYGFNAKPFAELVLVEDLPEDESRALARSQGWWFFKELATARRDVMDQWMGPMVHTIRAATASPYAIERQQVLGLIAALDPEGRAPPPWDATGPGMDEWVDDVLERVYPPIRKVSEGLVEIYEGRQRQKLIQVATDYLKRSALGQEVSGKYPNGDYYRGVEITDLPEPLRELGIPIGAVLCSINGQSVASEKEILDLLTRLLVGGAPTLVAEFVRNDKQHAIEFRIL